MTTKLRSNGVISPLANVTTCIQQGTGAVGIGTCTNASGCTGLPEPYTGRTLGDYNLNTQFNNFTSSRPSAITGA